MNLYFMRIPAISNLWDHIEAEDKIDAVEKMAAKLGSSTIEYNDPAAWEIVGIEDYDNLWRINERISRELAEVKIKYDLCYRQLEAATADHVHNKRWINVVDSLPVEGQTVYWMRNTFDIYRIVYTRILEDGFRRIAKCWMDEHDMIPLPPEEEVKHE